MDISFLIPDEFKNNAEFKEGFDWVMENYRTTNYDDWYSNNPYYKGDYLNKYYSWISGGEEAYYLLEDWDFIEKNEDYFP